MLADSKYGCLCVGSVVMASAPQSLLTQDLLFKPLHLGLQARVLALQLLVLSALQRKTSRPLGMHCKQPRTILGAVHLTNGTSFRACRILDGLTLHVWM